MAARNFYYGSDSRIVSGSANFASLISTGYAGYGISHAQAVAYGALDATLQAAYSAAVAPETRTPVAVSAKDLARRDVQIQAALLAKIAYATQTVADSQLVGLGLLPRSVPRPRAAATAPPVLEVISVVGRLTRVRIRAASAEGGRMPAATIGAQLYSFVSEDPPTDPRQYRYEGLATRGTAEVLFPNEVAGGSTVWIAAAWVSRRGVGGAPATRCKLRSKAGLFWR